MRRLGLVLGGTLAGLALAEVLVQATGIAPEATFIEIDPAVALSMFEG